jgi:hypothetical protein
MGKKAYTRWRAQSHQMLASDDLTLKKKLLWVDADGAAQANVKKKLGLLFRHPYFRCLVCYGITLLNFLMTAEDPVAHSRMEADIPIIGHDISFILNHTPDKTLYKVLKHVMWITSLLAGLIIGRQVIHHALLRDRWKLDMFTESRGTWIIMFFTTLLVLFLGAQLYNAVAAPDDEFLISGPLGTDNVTFMQVRLRCVHAWLFRLSFYFFEVWQTYRTCTH